MSRAACHHAFTLVELVLAIVVLGLLSVAALPIMGSALRTHSVARDADAALGDAGYAIERLVREIRELPAGADPGTVGLVELTPTRLEATNGLVIELVGERLMLTRAGGAEGTLCDRVDSFALTALGDDGSSAPATPAEVHRVRIDLTVDGFELVTQVFVRARTTG